MLPDRVSNPGPLTYESGALPIALRGPACVMFNFSKEYEQEGHKALNCSLSKRAKDKFFI